MLSFSAKKTHEKDRMDIYEIRRKALAQALDLKCNGRQVDMAEKTGIRPDYVSRMLNTGKFNKRIGGDFARSIEEKLGLTPNWLDQVENTAPAGVWPVVNLHVLQIAALKHRAIPGSMGSEDTYVIARRELPMGVEPDGLRHMRTEDQAMRICSGRRETVLIIDTSHTTPIDGRLFAVEHGNVVRARRTVLIDSVWVARADLTPDGRNPEFQIREAQIVGNVIWAGGGV